MLWIWHLESAKVVDYEKKGLICYTSRKHIVTKNYAQQKSVVETILYIIVNNRVEEVIFYMFYKSLTTKKLSLENTFVIH